MAIPKKQSRLIVVDEVIFRYKITGNDNIIYLNVEAEEVHGQRLLASFDYHHQHYQTKDDIKRNSVALFQRIQITPEVVKQAILYAIECGWSFDKKGNEYRINFIDNNIALKLKPEIEL